MSSKAIEVLRFESELLRYSSNYGWLQGYQAAGVYRHYSEYGMLKVTAVSRYGLGLGCQRSWSTLPSFGVVRVSKTKTCTLVPGIYVYTYFEGHI